MGFFIIIGITVVACTFMWLLEKERIKALFFRSQRQLKSIGKSGKKESELYLEEDPTPGALVMGIFCLLIFAGLPLWLWWLISNGDASGEEEEIMSFLILFMLSGGVGLSVANVIFVRAQTKNDLGNMRKEILLLEKKIKELKDKNT